ncbi:deoxycytidylate deaminase [Caudoviricetes sp.]|nr:deoxycytidylate deaminase [Caudoviricetes sp.]
MKNKWDARFIELANHVATWSKDPDAQVGAVIAKRNRRNPALGYNGFPEGISDSYDRLSNRARKNSLTIHAELNAILNADFDITGCTLYVSKPVCLHCAIIIAQKKLARVVQPMLDKASSWHSSQAEAVAILTEAGVQVDYAN